MGGKIKKMESDKLRNKIKKRDGQISVPPTLRHENPKKGKAAAIAVAERWYDQNLPVGSTRRTKAG
jgi:hypothetical protein